jgi:hypothetical protein
MEQQSGELTASWLINCRRVEMPYTPEERAREQIEQNYSIHQTKNKTSFAQNSSN